MFSLYFLVISHFGFGGGISVLIAPGPGHCIFVVPRLFEEKRRDIVFGIPSFRPPNIVGTLCAQLLLQFYADSIKTLQIFFVMV